MVDRQGGREQRSSGKGRQGNRDIGEKSAPVGRQSNGGVKARTPVRLVLSVLGLLCASGDRFKRFAMQRQVENPRRACRLSVVLGPSH
jgi:hypothetical protein